MAACMYCHLTARNNRGRCGDCACRATRPTLLFVDMYLCMYVLSKYGSDQALHSIQKWPNDISKKKHKKIIQSL